jgi:hypothetical protein
MQKKPAEREVFTANALADELGLDRRFVGRLLARVPYDGKSKRGWAGWHLETVAPIVAPHVSKSRYIRSCPRCGG